MAMKMNPNFREKLAIVRESFATLGFWMTLRYVAIFLLGYNPITDRSYDRRHGTDTGGHVLTEDLGIEDTAAKKDAVLYLPSPPRITRHILNSLNVDPSNYSFVDFGCGKGRVCLVASEYPFRKIIGVEISAELTKVAEANLTRYRGPQQCKDIQVHCGDAREFSFPAGNTVFHFYHPFEGDILRQVLKNLERSLAANPRHVLLAYLFVVKPAQDVISEFSFLRPVKEVQVANPQYNWAVYSNDASSVARSSTPAVPSAPSDEG